MRSCGYFGSTLRSGPGAVQLSSGASDAGQMHFGKVNDPTASDAVQIGHVDIHRIDAVRAKHLLGRRTRGQ